MTIKRSREDLGEVEALAMANCLMLLSNVGNDSTHSSKGLSERLFTCKTCNREFHSFQALGGHRASHKKSKLMGDVDLHLSDASESSHTKPKTHECSICGLEFSIGQALGGHMRRHRSSGTTAASETHFLVAPKVVPVLHKSNSIMRVWGLDLNLSPPENDLRLSRRFRNGLF